MTNRNRKNLQSGNEKRKDRNVEGWTTKEKKTDCNDMEGREKKMLTYNGDIFMRIILPILAMVISVIALCSQVIYSGMEYRYKIDPLIESEGTMQLGIEVGEDGRRVTSDFSNLRIQVKQKNNLQAAYLINADDTVEKLELNELENELETKISGAAELWKPDIVEGDVSYKYKFLFLKDLDGSYELFLFYIKSENERVAFHEVSEIEVLELEKAHPDDKKYIGEKQMAEKYAEILEVSEKYIF